MSQEIKIIHKPDDKEPFIILYKPRYMPSAPLNENDNENALSLCASMYPQIKNVKGKKEIEYGLIHRIDTVTDGLLLIACTQDFYDSLIEQQKESQFIKKYRAVCSFIPDLAKLKEGFSYCNNAEDVKKMKDGQTLSFVQEIMFRMYGPGRKEVRPVLENGSKAEIKKAGTKFYSTQIEVTKNSNEYKAVCTIKEGYRHQVRAHLAWSCLPVKGDRLYNPYCKEGDEFLFTAFYLSFKNPVDGSECVFEI